MRRNLLARTLVAACFSGALLGGTAVAQDAPPASTEQAPAPLATSIAAGGLVEAHLVSAVRDGDNLTVKVRFQTITDEKRSKTVYSTLSTSNWESDFYIVSGNKKYLILKDSSGVPLAPAALTLDTTNPIAASWSATFPAPPAGQTAMLHILDVEALGPFTVPE